MFRKTGRLGPDSRPNRNCKSLSKVYYICCSWEIVKFFFCEKYKHCSSHHVIDLQGIGNSSFYYFLQHPLSPQNSSSFSPLSPLTLSSISHLSILCLISLFSLLSLLSLLFLLSFPSLSPLFLLSISSLSSLSCLSSLSPLSPLSLLSGIKFGVFSKTFHLPWMRLDEDKHEWNV